MKTNDMCIQGSTLCTLRSARDEKITNAAIEISNFWNKVLQHHVVVNRISHTLFESIPPFFWNTHGGNIFLVEIFNLVMSKRITVVGACFFLLNSIFCKYTLILALWELSQWKYIMPFFPMTRNTEDYS